MNLMRQFRTLLIVGLLTAVAAGAAAGAGVFHTRLLDSAPKKDAVVAEAPREIRLCFSEPVETALTRVTVLGADSAEVGLGKVQASGDPAVVFAPVTGTMGPGTYLVRWRTTSKDGHVVRGTFCFRVGH